MVKSPLNRYWKAKSAPKMERVKGINERVWATL